MLWREMTERMETGCELGGGGGCKRGREIAGLEEGRSGERDREKKEEVSEGCE